MHLPAHYVLQDKMIELQCKFKFIMNIVEQACKQKKSQLPLLFIKGPS